MKKTSSKITLGSRLFIAFAFLCVALPLSALDSSVKVFVEPGLPATDTSSISADDLHSILSSATFVRLPELASALSDPQTKLFILPYGSSFPEIAWPDIQAYLRRGGNLLVLGGRPLTRAAYRVEGKWILREYSVRFAHALQIDQWQPTPASTGMQWERNHDIVDQLPPFEWRQAYSPVVHLSSSAISTRIGSAGALDARLDALAWGTRDGRRISAPVLQIDHLRGRFAGGRWIFVSADLPAGFASAASSRQLLGSLIATAARGAEEFKVAPSQPLYLPGETIECSVVWNAAPSDASLLTLKLTVTPESEPARASTQNVDFTPGMSVSLPSPSTAGFHSIEATLMRGDTPVAIHHSGFWMRDEAYLRGGPRLSVNSDYFELGGKPIAVIGTTYMGSDAQRLYFEHPNVFIWDRDLGQIQGAGLNMIRTGWWSGLDKLCDENGRPYERTLRTMEALLMTARKHNLPVQFNVFAFLPDVLGGANAYLDPEAIRRQQTLFAALAGRFHDVPYLAWDLINEPSFGQHYWEARPNGDPIELAEWNKWLTAKYPSRGDLEHAWNLPTGTGSGELPVPTPAEFAPRAIYDGANSLKVYDFYLFSQQKFAGWVAQMRDAIRGAGSRQLITIGQDEGGNTGRLSPAYFGAALDFTTNHSWWENDSLLWDSLVAKQPGKAMLVQETGLQRELTLDEIARRTVENEAALFERKVALSFAQGAGAIQWLWNTNDFMLEGNEAAIGALRADRTEKPEAEVLRAFADFAKAAGPSLSKPELPSVAIVTSEAAQYSPDYGLQLEAQRKAVRALCYSNQTPAYVVAESQLSRLGHPKLVILPSPQAFSESAWQAVLSYVKAGGNLLITGSVNRDEHWRVVDRMSGAGMQGESEPLTYRTGAIRVGDESIPMSFDQTKQSWLESVHFNQGATFEQIKIGQGQVFWVAYPVELADGTGAAAQVYGSILSTVGISPLFESDSKLSSGILIYPTLLRDAAMYILASDDAADTPIRIKDKLTGGVVSLNLKSQHAAMVLLRRKDGTVIAKYGF